MKDQIKQPTILITGGHITPALALLKELENKPVTTIVVGRDHSNNLGVKAKEAELVTKLGVDFVSFNPPKLYRKPLWLNVTQLPLIWSSLLKAWKIINQTQPDIVMTFGGYLALPIALVAKVKGIPIFVHEQTTVMGLTNRLVSSWAKRVFTSWPETRYAPTDSICIGNPLRKELMSSPPTPPWFHKSKQPIIYITGGNQGAVAINVTIEKLLPELTEKYLLVHQSGEVSLQQLTKSKEKLFPNQQQNYRLKPWFSADEVSWLLDHAALVVGRAGANTATELLLHQTPAILIPLPIAAGGEQLRNAQVLAEVGVAKILPQNNIDSLGAEIQNFFAGTSFYHPDTFKTNELIRRHQTAAHELAKEVLSCVGV